MSDESTFDNPLLGERGLFVSDRLADSVPPWGELIAELLTFRGLEDDWDGQGAEALPPALVDGAISLARRFEAEGHAPADRVTAGVNGTIFFSWHSPEGYREVEVVSPTEAEVRSIRNSSAEADESMLSW